ncbi:unnamed protein product, partial [Closterium sp. NIES-54]
AFPVLSSSFHPLKFPVLLFALFVNFVCQLVSSCIALSFDEGERRSARESVCTGANAQERAQDRARERTRERARERAEERAHEGARERTRERARERAREGAREGAHERA